MDNVKVDVNYYKDVAINYSVKLCSGILIIIVFYLIAKFVNYKFKNIITDDFSKDNNVKKKIIVYNFIGDIMYYVILVIGIIFFLLIFGIQLNSILVVLGSLGIAIALAIQGTIKEIVAGLMILVFNYYNIGDLIDLNGKLLFVSSFNLFNTTFKDVFDVKTIIPNSIISGGVVKILTANKNIYTEIFISISANNDINYGTLIDIIKNEIREKLKYLVNNDIIVQLFDMSSFGTQLRIRALVNSVNILDAKFETNLLIRNLLNKHSILLLDEDYLGELGS
jgi:small conductance mechanosensitive channel